jgi:hypothetical protein
MQQTDTITPEEAVKELMDARAGEQASEPVDELEPEESAEPEGELEETDEVEPGDTVDEVDDESDEEGPVLYAVRDGDEEKHVTLEELQEAYFNRSKQQSRFRELADERKRIEEAQTTIETERQRYVEGIERVQQALMVSGALEEPPAELAHTNPEEFRRRRLEVLESQQRMQALEQHKREEMAKAQQDVELKRQEYLKDQLTKLKKNRPDWENGEYARKRYEDIHSLAREYGYDDSDVAQIVDHRLVELLEDFVVLKNASTKGKKKLKSAKVVRRSQSRPSTPPRKGDRELKDLDAALEKAKGNPIDGARAAAALLLKEKELATQNRR